jgi:hypothetical protein
VLNVLSLLTVLLAAPPPPNCTPLQAAYQKLLASSFTMERHLQIIVDGEKKVQETARIDYAKGQVTRTVLNQEFSGSKKLGLNIQGDPAVMLKFNCGSFESLPDARYRFHTEKKGEGEIVFALDPQRGVLVPLSWTSIKEARFLFTKKDVKLVAYNTNFELH